jgi:hypothetical protein
MIYIHLMNKLWMKMILVIVIKAIGSMFFCNFVMLLKTIIVLVI